jgi:hypothetical protein
MPMAIWMDIEAMCPGIEPVDRSFMALIIEKKASLATGLFSDSVWD